MHPTDSEGQQNAVEKAGGDLLSASLLRSRTLALGASMPQLYRCWARNVLGKCICIDCQNTVNALKTSFSSGQ